MIVVERGTFCKYNEGTMQDGKRSFLPKIRIEAERRQTYERAVEKCQKRNPDLTLADWIRFACDQQAQLDLAKTQFQLESASRAGKA